VPIDASESLRALLQTLDPKARDDLRRVLIRDQADRDAISSRLMRYRDDGSVAVGLTGLHCGVSNEVGSGRLTDWPAWMKLDDQPRWWLKLSLPDGLRKIVRCDADGKKNAEGGFWRWSRSLTLARVTASL
jgi:hypothetical protein